MSIWKTWDETNGEEHRTSSFPQRVLNYRFVIFIFILFYCHMHAHKRMLGVYYSVQYNICKRKREKKKIIY